MPRGYCAAGHGPCFRQGSAAGLLRDYCVVTDYCVITDYCVGTMWLGMDPGRSVRLKRDSSLMPDCPVITMRLGVDTDGIDRASARGEKLDWHVITVW